MATPTPTEGEPRVSICGKSYDVNAEIVDGRGGLDLEQLINNVVITDSDPFECKLPGEKAQSTFSFDGTVTNSGCPYVMSYVNDDTGKSFSGSVTLDCQAPTLDYTATATPDLNDPSCRGRSSLVDDPKIKLNTDDCTGDVD